MILACLISNNWYCVNAIIETLKLEKYYRETEMEKKSSDVQTETAKLTHKTGLLCVLAFYACWTIMVHFFLPHVLLSRITVTCYTQFFISIFLPACVW